MEFLAVLFAQTAPAAPTVDPSVAMIVGVLSILTNFGFVGWFFTKRLPAEDAARAKAETEREERLKKERSDQEERLAKERAVFLATIIDLKNSFQAMMSDVQTARKEDRAEAAAALIRTEEKNDRNVARLVDSLQKLAERIGHD